MPAAAAPSLFARLTQRRPRGRRLPEPADMGTAFGMEQWLDERDHMQPAAGSVRARRFWLPRWLQPTSLR